MRGGGSKGFETGKEVGGCLAQRVAPSPPSWHLLHLRGTFSTLGFGSRAWGSAGVAGCVNLGRRAWPREQGMMTQARATSFATTQDDFEPGSRRAASRQAEDHETGSTALMCDPKKGLGFKGFQLGTSHSPRRTRRTHHHEHVGLSRRRLSIRHADNDASHALACMRRQADGPQAGHTASGAVDARVTECDGNQASTGGVKSILRGRKCVVPHPGAAPTPMRTVEEWLVVPSLQLSASHLWQNAAGGFKSEWTIGWRIRRMRRELHRPSAVQDKTDVKSYKSYRSDR
eukprot:356639-Chlamydomonas_euryale.AAC.2